MAKKEFKNLNLDVIWDGISADYQKAKFEYEEKWSKKHRTMILLYCVLVIPGFIYQILVWNKGNNERWQAANSFLNKSLNSINTKNKTKKDHWLSDMNATINQGWTVKTYPLPMGKLADIHNWLSPSLYRTKVFSTILTQIYKDTKINADDVAGILTSSEVLAEVSGKTSFGKAVLKGLTQGYSKGETVSLNLEISTSAKVSMEVSGVKVNIFNLKTTIIKQERVKRKGEWSYNTTRDDTFVGVIAQLSEGTTYPHRLVLKTKTWERKTNKRISNKLKQIEFELGSDTFMDKFKVLVDKEDGVALRKTIEPRTLGAFLQIEEDNRPFLMSSKKGKGLVMALESHHRSDMPLYLADTRLFFKDEKYAKDMVSKDLQPVIAMANAIRLLKESKLIKK